MNFQERVNRESAAQLAAATASDAPLGELAVAASVLALSLFQCDVLRCTEREPLGRGCLFREGKRLRGYPQLPSGSLMRSWSMFDPAKLCNHCRPYWYAEMAADEMRRCAHFEAVDAAAAKEKA